VIFNEEMVGEREMRSGYCEGVEENSNSTNTKPEVSSVEPQQRPY